MAKTEENSLAFEFFEQAWADINSQLQAGTAPPTGDDLQKLFTGSMLAWIVNDYQYHKLLHNSDGYLTIWFKPTKWVKTPGFDRAELVFIESSEGLVAKMVRKSENPDNELPHKILDLCNAKQFVAALEACYVGI